MGLHVISPDDAILQGQRYTTAKMQPTKVIAKTMFCLSFISKCLFPGGC